MSGLTHSAFHFSSDILIEQKSLISFSVVIKISLKYAFNVPADMVIFKVSPVISGLFL